MAQLNFNGSNSDGSFTMANWNYHHGLYRSFYAQSTLDVLDYHWPELFFIVPSLFNLAIEVLLYIQASSKDSDQTGLPSLIRVFAGCTGHFVYLSYTVTYNAST